MVEAWTGVIRVKPMLDTASRTQSDKEGVIVLHALDEVFNGDLEVADDIG